MSPEQRERATRELSELIDEWVKTCRTMGIRFTADDCAEFVVGGADWPDALLAEAWDDGVEWTMAAAGQFTGQPPNPYRPDQTARAQS